MAIKNGWLSSETHVAVGAIIWLGHALTNPHLFPITHVACAAALGFVAHAIVKNRTQLKLNDAGVVPVQSLLSHIWSWIRNKRVAKPIKPPTEVKTVVILPDSKGK